MRFRGIDVLIRDGRVGVLLLTVLACFISHSPAASRSQTREISGTNVVLTQISNPEGLTSDQDRSISRVRIDLESRLTLMSDLKVRLLCQTKKSDFPESVQRQTPRAFHRPGRPCCQPHLPGAATGVRRNLRAVPA